MVCAAFDEKMEMIRHEAVRKNCKRLFLGRSTYLSEHQVNGGCFGEERAPPIGTESQ
jgi:hypothetical protein